MLVFYLGPSTSSSGSNAAGPFFSFTGLIVHKASSREDVCQWLHLICNDSVGDTLILVSHHQQHNQPRLKLFQGTSGNLACNGLFVQFEGSIHAGYSH